MTDPSNDPAGEKAATDWLVLSLKWTGASDVLVWYRANAAGYTVCLEQAGRYTEAEARGHAYPDLTVAVPLSAARDAARAVVLNRSETTLPWVAGNFTATAKEIL